jgi:hypothetical protein
MSALTVKKLETVSPTTVSDPPSSLAYRGRNGITIPIPKVTRNTERHNIKNILGYFIKELSKAMSTN